MSRKVGRRSVAIVLLAVCSLALAGCASFAQQYPVDKSLDKLPLVPADTKVVDLLPLIAQGHVIATIRVTGDVQAALALRDGNCYLAILGPHGDNIEFGGKAPTTSSSASLGGSWRGEMKVIGPSDDQGSSVRGIHFDTDCGTRGIWIGVSVPRNELTATGPARFPAAAQSPTKTGIVITAAH
jgi:hypothetical protein